MNCEIIDIKILSDSQLGFSVSGNDANYLRVSDLKHSGPAFNAGLKKNDLLVRINGVSIHNKDDLLTAVKLNKGFTIVQVCRKREMKSESMRIHRRHSIDVKTLHQNLVTKSGHRVGMEIDRSDLCNVSHRNKPNRGDASARRYAWTLSRSDAKTIHSDLVNQSGCRVGMEISRSPLSPRYNNTSRVKFFETKLEEKCSNLSRIDETYKSDNCFKKPPIQPKKRPVKRQNNTFRLSSSPSDTSTHLSNNREGHQSTLSPRTHFKSESNIHASYTHNNNSSSSSSFSTNHKPDYLYSPNHNRVNNKINSFSRSVQHINSVDNSANVNRHSGIYSMNYSTTSISSLFDSSDTNIHPCITNNTEKIPPPVTMLDYHIQWFNVYRTISSILTTPFEESLVRFFKSLSMDQIHSEYPVNCMYRYITFDDAMKVLFEYLLTSNADTNASIDLDQVLQSHSEKDTETLEISKTKIECWVKNNHRKLDENYQKFKVDNTQLTSKKENLKSELVQYLTNRQNKDRMEVQVDRLFSVFNQLGCLSINLVTSLSMKMFNDKYTMLYNGEGNVKHDSMMNNGGTENLSHRVLNSKNAGELYEDLSQFKRIQSHMERHIIHFFSRFRADSDDNVNRLFDRVYSELLNVSICLPLLEEKLKRDEGILSYLSEEHDVKSSLKHDTSRISMIQH